MLDAVGVLVVPSVLVGVVREVTEGWVAMIRPAASRPGIRGRGCTVQAGAEVTGWNLVDGTSDFCL
jgi:hypothetical protein